MTQIGKECHSHCKIYERMGECIMPKEGVFAVVINGGMINEGDEVKMLEARKDEWDFALKNPLDKAKQMGLM